MYKKLFEGKKAAIFDLDGTIFKEGEAFRKEAFIEVLKDVSLSYIDPVPYCISGYTSEEIWKAIIYGNEIKNRNLEELVDKTRRAYVEIVKNKDIQPTEGFWDLFNELKQEKGYKIGLATSASKFTQELTMEKLGIKDIFDATIFGDEIGKRKPNPEIFKKILKRLKVRPKETILFEDSVIGVKAAKKAKIDTIVIWDGETMKREYGDNAIDFSTDFTQYPGRLDETHEEYLLRSFKEATESN